MKKIVICFDGTGNEPSDAQDVKERDGTIEDDSISNILKLFFLLGGQIENLSEDKIDYKVDHVPSTFENQPCFYFQGVGTYGGFLRQLLNMAFAPERLDVSRIIHRASDALKSCYELGDEIYIFGFSRGAAIARRFASVIHKDKDPEEHGEVMVPNIGVGSVTLLCAFDTVSAFNKPGLLKSQANSDVLFENANVVGPAVKEAWHLVSLDERRKEFRPTLMAPEARVKEVWFPGVHSDIGGGYRKDQLSDITLQYVVSELGRRGFGLKMRSTTQVSDEEFAKDTFGLDHGDIEIIPEASGTLHWHDRKAVMKNRKIALCQSGGAAETKPVLHPAVLERIRGVETYHPAAVKPGLVYRVLQADGTPSGDKEFDASEIRGR